MWCVTHGLVLIPCMCSCLYPEKPIQVSRHFFYTLTHLSVSGTTSSTFDNRLEFNKAMPMMHMMLTFAMVAALEGHERHICTRISLPFSCLHIKALMFYSDGAGGHHIHAMWYHGCHRLHDGRQCQRSLSHIRPSHVPSHSDKLPWHRVRRQ